MKKRIVIITLSILLVTGLLIIILNKNAKVYTDIDGIKYAILVDGISSNSFPSGNYKVDLKCTNAYAYWDSIANKVIIKRITGNVSCNISFNSITNGDYINNYVVGLSGTTQGDGQLVHEIGSLPDYTNSSIVTEYGTTPVYFRNTSYKSTTQTEVSDYWTFNSSTGVFTSDPSKMTTSGTNNYYHAYAQVPEAGNYQICYTIAQSLNDNNLLYISKNTDNLVVIGSSTSTQVGEACYDMGRLTATDYINIAEYGYSGTSSPVMTFRVEKTSNTTTIDTGYRYEGKNPNNYIMFNNELWRIIGTFETEYDINNDGIIDATKSLVKIIRETNIGSLVWDKNNNNDWPNSSLYHLLNEQYYDWDTYNSNINSYCFKASNTNPAICNYSVIGIQDGYRDMIVKAKWYLGGKGKDGYKTDKVNHLYSYERDANAVYSGRSANTLGYIGLMYESDYLYGALSSYCDRDRFFQSYIWSSCSGNNWLYGQGYQWTIVHNSNTNNGTTVINYRSFISSEVNVASNVRPTLYLSPNVYRVSGYGTIADPYIIGLASNN